MNDELDKPQLTTFCPSCNRETFVVIIEESGTSQSTPHGHEIHWFGGDGECYECHYSGYHSDSN